MTRIELPDRREHLKTVVEFRTRSGDDATILKMHVTVSFAAVVPAVVPIALEVFINGGGKVKTGSERDFLLNDVAVMISTCLQMGIRPLTLRRRLGEDPHRPGAPLSLIAAVLDAVIELEQVYRGEAHPKAIAQAHDASAASQDGAPGEATE
jgi:hypothetical protein